MSQQSVRQAARRSALDAQAVLRKERADRKRRLEGLAVAFWFDFAWVLADGTPARFTVVDIAELTEDGLIARLHIVYDTAPIRADFERATRTGKS
jgi:hypothetical protein